MQLGHSVLLRMLDQRVNVLMDLSEIHFLEVPALKIYVLKLNRVMNRRSALMVDANKDVKVLFVELELIAINPLTNVSVTNTLKGTQTCSACHVSTFFI